MSLRGGESRGERGLAGKPPPQEGPSSAWRALRSLADVVLRSGAPQLHARLTAALVLTVAGKVLGVGAPLLLGAAVNRLAAGQGAAVGAASAFAAFVAGWALIRFFSAAAPQARDALFSTVSLAAQRRAAADAFGHALALSLDYHQTKRSGTLSRTIERGARSVDLLLRALVFNLAPTGFELVLAAGVLGAAYDWRFAATAVVTVLIYGVLTFAISNWRLEHRRVMNAADSEASGQVIDSLLNYETVKAFGAEGRAVDAYEDALGRYGAASVKANASLAMLNAVQAAIMNIGLLVMALLAGLEAAAGRMGPGDVTAAVLILISLYQPLNILGFAYREIRQAFIDMEAMTALTKLTPEIADASDAQALPACASGTGGELAFEDVSFRHDARLAGLQDVSFRAPHGTTVALVGPSGSGKSTIVRLAMRLLDPQSGRVTLDGMDLRQATQASLRECVALVPQDVALFNDTLRFNIGFAEPGATEAQVWAAADAAELGEFIRGLPEGLETRVGERGLKLSGGERQRVGIARALLANPRLLILDEATSALDGRTEAAIQETLRRARSGRTTLVIAHRLSTVADADEILVLREGRIVERGRHETLLALDGEYATLWRRQVREGE